MPLRDHFEDPNRRLWERVHGGWPMVMVQHLFRTLPSRYHVAPQVHLGQYFEVDIATYDTDHNDRPSPGSESTEGGLTTAVWAPPEPTLTLETELPDPDEYEVRIFDAEDGQRLVAVIELVSPSNKDRPESRRAFVAKCAALLQQDVCVSIVDLVTVRQFNLYSDLLDLLGRSDPAMGPPAPHLYAVTIRRRSNRPRWTVDTWAHPLRIGDRLPTLPIWLADGEGAMLDLEATYEETCRVLRVN
ncbi:MAG: DUF4058 family protein [Gemmataceae bacterium]|nr:DUF4058 family protein [Gemmataceae bacterium]